MKKIPLIITLLLIASFAWAGPPITQAINTSAMGDISVDALETNGDVNFLLGATDNVVVDGRTTVHTDADGILSVWQTTASEGNKNIYNSLIDTSTTGHAIYGQYNEIASFAVVTGTAQNIYGEKTHVLKSGADTNANTTSLWGSSFSAENTGSTDAGTKETYGIQVQAVGDTAGTSRTWGGYFSATGADTNVALFTAAGDVEFRPGATENVYINGVSTAQTQTSGLLQIDATTSTDAYFGQKIDVTNTATSGQATTGLSVALRNQVVVTATNQSMYGAEFSVTKSGADTNANAVNARGINSQAQITGSTDTGTRTSMGGYFSGTGDTAGTSTAYGIFATATGADTNYAGYFDGDIAVTGTIAQNGLKYFSSATAEADEGHVDLPTITANYSGHGFVRVSSAGVIQDSCEFESGSDGNVALIRGTANVVVGAACADAKICISTAGAQNPIIVQSRNGAAQVEIEFWYK